MQVRRGVCRKSDAARTLYGREVRSREASERNMVVTINGIRREFAEGERLIDLLNRTNHAGSSVELPQVCYHSQLGPIQTCDTCMVEADSKLVRACATQAVDGMRVETSSPRASAAQREAMDRILGNHMLYCTVCDTNNGN